MKILNAIIAVAAAALGAVATGCSDDETLTPLTATDGTVAEAAYSTLTFKWGAVEGARQYSCQLREGTEGSILATEVVKTTSITFDNLQPSTDYTLTVLAYATIGSGFTTSEPIVVTGRTADIQAIPSPVVSVTREVNSMIFEWAHIESAASYRWELLDGAGNIIDEGSTRALNATVEDLATGSYTFKVTACTDEPGFKDSEPSVTKFDFVRQSLEVWSVTGTYSSALLGKQWSAVLTAYDDNSYRLAGWYGAEGSDLLFTVDPEDADDMFHLPADTYSYDQATGRYAVPTGLASPATVYVTPGGNRCALEGNAGGGSLMLAVSDGTASAEDEFTWGLSIDDICGEWMMHTTCMADMEEYDEDYDNTTRITITKIDDTTVEMPLPYYNTFMVRATLDVATGQLTILPTDGAGTYYTFASYDGEDLPVVATVSKSRFVLSNWTYWYCYSGTWYQYTQGPGKAEFTRE